MSGLFPRARSQFLRLPPGRRAREEALLLSRFPQPLKQESPSSASLRTARHVPVRGRGSCSRGRGAGTVQKVCAAARAGRREEGGAGSSPGPGQSAPLPGRPTLADLCSAPPCPAPSRQRLPGKGRGGRRSERNSPTVRQRAAESRRSPAPPPPYPAPSGAQAGLGRGGAQPARPALGSAPPLRPRPSKAPPLPPPLPPERGRQVRGGEGWGRLRRGPGARCQGEGGGASEGKFPPKLEPRGMEDTSPLGTRLSLELHHFTNTHTHTHNLYNRAKRFITWVLLSGERETPPCNTHSVSIGVRVTVHWQFSPKYEGSLIGQFNSEKKLPHFTTPRKMREQVGNPFPYAQGMAMAFGTAFPEPRPFQNRTPCLLTAYHRRPCLLSCWHCHLLLPISPPSKLLACLHGKVEDLLSELLIQEEESNSWLEALLAFPEPCGWCG